MMLTNKESYNWPMIYCQSPPQSVDNDPTISSQGSCDGPVETGQQTDLSRIMQIAQPQPLEPNSTKYLSQLTQLTFQCENIEFLLQNLENKDNGNEHKSELLASMGVIIYGLICKIMKRVEMKEKLQAMELEIQLRNANNDADIANYRPNKSDQPQQLSNQNEYATQTLRYVKNLQMPSLPQLLNYAQRYNLETVVADNLHNVHSVIKDNRNHGSIHISNITAELEQFMKLNYAKNICAQLMKLFKKVLGELSTQGRSLKGTRGVLDELSEQYHSSNKTIIPQGPLSDTHRFCTNQASCSSNQQFNQLLNSRMEYLIDLEIMTAQFIEQLGSHCSAGCTPPTLPSSHQMQAQFLTWENYICILEDTIKPNHNNFRQTVNILMVALTSQQQCKQKIQISTAYHIHVNEVFQQFITESLSDNPADSSRNTHQLTEQELMRTHDRFMEQVFEEISVRVAEYIRLKFQLQHKKSQIKDLQHRIDEQHKMNDQKQKKTVGSDRFEKCSRLSIARNIEDRQSECIQNLIGHLQAKLKHCTDQPIDNQLDYSHSSRLGWNSGLPANQQVPMLTHRSYPTAANQFKVIKSMHIASQSSHLNRNSKTVHKQNYNIKALKEIQKVSQERIVEFAHKRLVLRKQNTEMSQGIEIRWIKRIERIKKDHLHLCFSKGYVSMEFVQGDYREWLSLFIDHYQHRYPHIVYELSLKRPGTGRADSKGDKMRCVRPKHHGRVL